MEKLEAKHQSLEKSYSEVEGAHAKLQRECEELRDELSTLRGSSVGGSSREGSVGVTHSRFKMEDAAHQQPNIFDPFGTDDFFA